MTAFGRGAGGVVKYLFVGERPSTTASLKGWTWQDGRLAAKQLFDALQEAGVDPASQSFVNWFGTRSDGPFVVSRTSKRVVREALASGVVIVGMGKRVCESLARHDISHVEIVHPAARGAIRKKERYITHIKERLA
jgi:hypothetical protein